MSAFENSPVEDCRRYFQLRIETQECVRTAYLRKNEKENKGADSGFMSSSSTGSQQESSVFFAE